MTNNTRWGLDNPHPFSKVKKKLISYLMVGEVDRKFDNLG